MLIFDLETDGLLPDVSKIHCLFIYDGSRMYAFDPLNSPVEEGVRMLQEAECICGHNIEGYDIPVLKHLYGFKRNMRTIDTMIWAKLNYPDIKSTDFGRMSKGMLPGKLVGSHSLKAWGYRLGEFKGDFGETTDWQEWDPEMSRYCKQDVLVTHKLYQRLEYKGVASMDAFELEHEVSRIIQRQEQKGFCFEEEKAEQLYMELLEARELIKRELQDLFPPIFVKDKEFTPKRNNKTRGYVAGATMTKIRLQEFDPGSRPQIINRLKKMYGWEPTEYTEKGNPKVDEDTLKTLDYPPTNKLVEYMTIQKRISQLAEGDVAWLKKVHRGRIHGSVNPLGAGTGRMTHFNPNLAQVPSNHAPWGKRCRELFCVPEGRKLVGCDADGLEMRCLAHYMARWDNGEYAKAVVEGTKEDGTDPHSLNAKALGLSRDEAKTWFYGFIYGAGDKLLGKGDAKKGRKLREKFLKNLPALKKLTEAVQKKAGDQKWIKGLDGRKVPIRSQHSALNFLLQGAGAIVMKRALVICDGMLRDRGYHVDYREDNVSVEFVANVHDEFQMESHIDIAEEVGKIAADSIRLAGEYYNFRCPLSGSYDIGENWKETH